MARVSIVTCHEVIIRGYIKINSHKKSDMFLWLLVYINLFFYLLPYIICESNISFSTSKLLLFFKYSISLCLTSE